MFSEEKIRAYRSVKAPETLRDAVLASSQRENGTRSVGKWMLPVAACLVLCVSLWLLNPWQTEISVRLDGKPLEETVTLEIADASPLRRSAPSISVPVELELGKEVEISVSKGKLILEGKEPASTLTVGGTVAFVWEIPSKDGAFPCTMELDENGSKTVIELRSDEKTGFVIAEKTEK